ncbi:MAG TPA: methionyl-tRNA formyltransferase [Pseudolysinimonas sp.]|nr:methionyl-tRNA formyltransferase [Pseudolysinimonas sp.]
MTSLRILFAGSPAAAVPSLKRLVSSSHEVISAVTREDSPQGRRRVLTPTPVAQAADDAGVPIIRANRLAPVTDAIAELAPDLGVVVAYGGLIRRPLLELPRLGWINLHFSLLPAWRGAAPVQRALMAGDTYTGAAVFQLVDELDAGPVYATLTVPIGANDTAGVLLESLSEQGAELLSTVVDALADGTAVATPQEGTATSAPKLTLEDGKLQLTRAAMELAAQIRGVTPEPGAFVIVDGERFKILEATALPPQESPEALASGVFGLVGGRVVLGTASGVLELRRVQAAGKRAMDAADWWRGRPSDRHTVAE